MGTLSIKIRHKKAQESKEKNECVCYSTSHLRCESVVVRSLAGEQDVREALLLPDHDVAESTVALILSHVVSEPLVKHVAFLLDKLPLY